MAELLYDSLFGKLLPLGDGVLVYPAHGAGSVCGGGLADREFTNLGYERRHYPALQAEGRQAFVGRKTADEHLFPSYFRRMEALNRDGAPAGAPLRPRPLSPDAFAKAADEGMLVLDVRDPEATGGASIPRSLSIPVEMLSAYGGWFVPDDRDLGLVASGASELQPAVRQLFRMGYDRIAGYLRDGMHGWEVTGRPFQRSPSVHAADVARRIRSGERFTLLDVRRRAEVEAGRLPGSTHVFLGDLPEALDRIPLERPVTTFCGSGLRAAIASSLLLARGIREVETCLGSMAACAAVGCPVERGPEQ